MHSCRSALRRNTRNLTLGCQQKKPLPTFTSSARTLATPLQTPAARTPAHAPTTQATAAGRGSVATMQSRKFASASKQAGQPDVAPYVVHSTHGGTPMGGFKAANIYAVENLPPVLKNMSADPLPENALEDLSERANNQQAFLIHHILSDKEADAVIQLADQIGFTDAAPEIGTPPGMRMNLAMHWVDDGEWVAKLFARAKHLLPAEIDGKKLVGFGHRLDMYKYEPGMHFKRHTDGDWPGYRLSEDGRKMDTCGSDAHSKLSMLLYLNGKEDGVKGGQTKLFHERAFGESARGVGFHQVDPVKGSALFFRHGIPGDKPGTGGSVMHAGSESVGEVPKYVARINVLYEAHDAEEMRRFREKDSEFNWLIG